MVLVVEDDAELRSALTEALQVESVRVVVAGDEMEALGLLRRGAAPSVILLDLHSPHPSDEDFLRALRADPRHERVPVITMAGGVDSALEGEAVARLRRSCDLDDLRAIVLSLFEASAA